MLKKLLDYRLLLAVLTAGLWLIAPLLIAADPLPPVEVEPGYEDPIPVFCFLMTDIEGAGTNRFQRGAAASSFTFQFEVLNWSNVEVYGVTVMLNQGTGRGTVVNGLPTLVNANIDANGQPIGAAGDNGQFIIPPQQATDNKWGISKASASSITWSGISSPVQPIDLLDGSQIDPSPRQPNLVRPIQVGEPMVSFMNFTTPNDSTSLEPTTIDNGPNVLDGFVFTVTDFDPGEVMSLNWFLLDQNGNPIGTPSSGNSFGFGVINIKRVDGDPTLLNDPIFKGNTGFDQSQRSFYNNVYDGGAAFQFGVEFGPSLTAPFLNPQDNIFGIEPNATFFEKYANFLPAILIQPTATPTPTPTPQPGFDDLQTPTPTP